MKVVISQVVKAWVSVCSREGFPSALNLVYLIFLHSHVSIYSDLVHFRKYPNAHICYVGPLEMVATPEGMAHLSNPYLAWKIKCQWFEEIF